MKVLAFADIHQEEAALASLSALAPAYDLVFCCGDVSQNNLFAEEVIKSLPNCLIIPGNWDDKRVNEVLSSSAGWMQGKRREIGDGLNVVGFGFSNITPFGTYGELEEEEIYRRMSSLDIDENTLLLLHCPPKGHFDSVRGVNAGSESILRIINERMPLAAFFGHIHEHVGTEILGSTLLVKLPPAEGMRACSLSIERKKINADFIKL